jgi:hypothetical protein
MTARWCLRVCVCNCAICMRCRQLPCSPVRDTCSVCPCVAVLPQLPGSAHDVAVQGYGFTYGYIDPSFPPAAKVGQPAHCACVRAMHSCYCRLIITASHYHRPEGLFALLVMDACTTTACCTSPFYACTTCLSCAALTRECILLCAAQVIKRMCPECKVSQVPHSGPSPVLIRPAELALVAPDWETYSAWIEDNEHARNVFGE